MRTTNTRCSGAGPVFYATSLVLLAIAAASVRQDAGGAACAVCSPAYYGLSLLLPQGHSKSFKKRRGKGGY